MTFPTTGFLSSDSGLYEGDKKKTQETQTLPFLGFWAFSWSALFSPAEILLMLALYPVPGVLSCIWRKMDLLFLPRMLKLLLDYFNTNNCAVPSEQSRDCVGTLREGRKHPCSCRPWPCHFVRRTAASHAGTWLRAWLGIREDSSSGPFKRWDPE